MGSTSVVGGSKTEELRHDIERTQREMGETIHEIEHRLSPRHLMDQTKESVRRTGVNTSQKLIDTVKNNPIPAAMVGVGLWLLFRHSSDDGSAMIYTHRDSIDSDEPSKLDTAKAKATDAVHSARDRASQVAGAAREKVTQATDDARESASAAAERARARAVQMRMQTRDVMRESPLVAGIAAIALGAIVGAIIPETEKEDQMLGETRDRLLDRGKELAREGVEKAKHVAQSAVESAKQELR
jgi:ElaB/YqjD/DUF883 family membrane-anchored ribosome-binding protein